MRRTLLAIALLLAAPLGAQPKAPPLGDGVDPNDWRSYYLAGVERFPRGGKESIPYFQWAHELSPGSPEPLHGEWVARWMDNIPLFVKDVKPGARWWDRVARIDSLLYDAYEIDPFVAQNYTRLIFDAIEGEYDTEKFTRGFLAYSEGRYAQATELLRQPAAQPGSSGRAARYYRALAFYQMQAWDSAGSEMATLAAQARAQNAKKLGRVYETPAMHEYAVAMAMTRKGDLAAARAALGRALEEDLSIAAAHALLGQIEQRDGNMDAMVTEWTTAASLRPQSAYYADGLGTALRVAGKREEAVAAYEKAIALAPRWAAPRFNLALVLEELGRRKEAITSYSEFVARAPRVYEAQVALAQRKMVELAGK